MAIWHKEVWSEIGSATANPVIAELYEAWRSLPTKSHGLPDHQAFRAQCLARAWGSMMELKVLAGEQDFQYCHYGIDIRRRAGFDMTDKKVSEFGGEVGDYYLARYQEVLQKHRPLYTVHFAEKAKSVFTWERLICPVIDEAGHPWLLVYNTPLESRHQVLEAVLNATNDGILALRACRDSDEQIDNWVVLVANPIMADLLGMDTSTAVGHLATEVIPGWRGSPLETQALNPTHQLSGGDFDIQIERSDGPHMYAGHVGPMPDGCVIQLSDVTQSKANERELRDMAFTDGLTRVPNRRAFDERLQLEFARSRRNRQPLSVIMLDVDLFKRYNDHYGHLAGDDCLVALAATLRQCLRRPTDFVARYGGEEFACILADTSASDALALAQLMESRVRALGIAHVDSDVAPVITISLGVAVGLLTQQDQPDALVARADQNLYVAKGAGRGRAYASPVRDASPPDTGA